MTQFPHRTLQKSAGEDARCNGLGVMAPVLTYFDFGMKSRADDTPQKSAGEDSFIA